MRRSTIPRGRLPVLILAGLATACGLIPGLEPPPPAPGGVVTTLAVPLPDLGPPPAEIPANPRQLIVLRPPPPGSDAAFDRVMVEVPDYVPGSGRVEAVYPDPRGEEWLVSFQIGGALCRAVTSAGAVPGGWGCSTGGSDDPRTIQGYGYTSHHGPDNMIEVEHSPDAEAVVVELADDSIFVIRPGPSAYSYHRWNGAPPVRFTVFWDDGSSTSEILYP